MEEIKNNSKEKDSTSWIKIKSKYILKNIFGHLKESKLLNIIRYNKKLKKIADKKMNDYINEYSKIIIEIIPIENIYGTFINYTKKTKPYFHIYFNDKEEEIKRNIINKDDKVFKIKIIIDNKVKTLVGLFKKCECIKVINIIKFNRTDINNMSYMFYQCSKLNEINFLFFNTNNVEKMKSMFHGCLSLKELDLSKFNTENVTDMTSMFDNCLSLKELNLSNFNTSNAETLSWMFNRCTSLKELNLSNFVTNNLKLAILMFHLCLSLKKLNLSNFNVNNETILYHIFKGCYSLEELDISNCNYISGCMLINNCLSLKKIKCSDEIKMIIKNKYKYLLIE